MRYWLGFGSNVGDRRANIEEAAEKIRKLGLKIIRKSSFYRTEPVGFAPQPWFINQVMEVDADLSPGELLHAVKAIETGMGRRPGRRNGPRSIDIDILLAGDTVLQSPELVIPHPRLAERRFVLIPLEEIAPDLVHPESKESIRTVLRGCPDRSVVERISRRTESSILKKKPREIV